MGDENPIRTLRDYSKPSHEGYRNTIELPIRNDVVPLLSDTIRLVQNGCSFYRHQSEDPNQHLKDFLKLVDSPDLDVANRERTHFGPHDTQYCMVNPEQAFVEYTSSRIDEAGVLAHASIYNSMLDKYVESLELGKNGSAFVQGKVSAKMEDPGLFTLPCRLGDSKPFDTLADLGSCVNIILLYLFKKLNIRLLEETDHIFRLADGTKSYPVGIVKDVEVHIGKLKLLNDFYVIDMKKDPETPLLVGRGFLATANAVIDCRKAKIMVGEGITKSVFGVKGIDLGARAPYYARKDFLDCHLPEEWEIARDAEINPFKDVLVFRRMDKPTKHGDGAWHAKIRLIDPDGEEFTKTIQSIPTSRKLSERESPKEIINLDHFYDT
ncbi:MAK10-like protein [Tanacetum coccineum]